MWIRTLKATQLPGEGVKVISPEVLPPRYHDESELTFLVPDQGTDSANFDLRAELTVDPAASH